MLVPVCLFLIALQLTGRLAEDSGSAVFCSSLMGARDGIELARHPTGLATSPSAVSEHHGRTCSRRAFQGIEPSATERERCVILRAMAQPALTVDEAPPPPVPDSIIVLNGASWADYQRVMELRGENSVPRIAYLEGKLELMSPSHTHQAIKSMLGCLIEAWCLENGVDITPYGAWTHESKLAERGVEPDECYVLGDNPEPERCDLAIEVVWTSGGIKKLDIYRKLKVREVWFWKNNTLSLYWLQDEKYHNLEHSRLLPGIDPELLLTFVDVRPMTRAVREYRAALTK